MKGGAEKHTTTPPLQRTLNCSAARTTLRNTQHTQHNDTKRSPHHNNTNTHHTQHHTHHINIPPPLKVEAYYFHHYSVHFGHEEYGVANRSIPYCMTWDDHDIFDGWGSYPEPLQLCDVFQVGEKRGVVRVVVVVVGGCGGGGV